MPTSIKECGFESLGANDKGVLFDLMNLVRSILGFFVSPKNLKWLTPPNEEDRSANSFLPLMSIDPNEDSEAFAVGYNGKGEPSRWKFLSNIPIGAQLDGGYFHGYTPHWVVVTTAAKKGDYGYGWWYSLRLYDLRDSKFRKSLASYNRWRNSTPDVRQLERIGRLVITSS